MVVEMLKLRDSGFMINANIWSHFTEVHIIGKAGLGKIKVFISKVLWDT